MTDLNPRYGDSCERCIRLDRSTVVEPLAAIPDGGGGMTAAYRCPKCRHTWTCYWGIVPGRALPPEPTGREPFPLNHLVAELYEQHAIGRAFRHLRRGPGEAA
jgi:hypothetical protein